MQSPGLWSVNIICELTTFCELLDNWSLWADEQKQAVGEAEDLAGFDFIQAHAVRLRPV